MTSRPVLRLVEPLTPMYVGRDSPQGVARQQIRRAHKNEVRREDFEPFVVEAIVTVDAKVRAPWPSKDLRLGANVASVTDIEEATVVITLTDTRRSDTWRLDGHGRPQLHHGVHRGAGRAPGHRLAIVRLDQGLRVVLTTPANLAVRRGPK